MDEFLITIPREPTFATVAGLVVGGIAARHEFTLDVLDDLQLALDSLLERLEEDADDDGDVTVEVRVDDTEVSFSIGPLRDETVAELEDASGIRLGLRRLLDTTVDDVALAIRGDSAWVELRKAYALAGAEG
jgi:hypothetical protein